MDGHNSSSQFLQAFYSLFGTIPSDPVMTETTVTFIFHHSLTSMARSLIISSTFTLYEIYSVNSSYNNLYHVFFCFTTTGSSLLISIRLSLCVYKMLFAQFLVERRFILQRREISKARVFVFFFFFFWRRWVGNGGNEYTSLPFNNFHNIIIKRSMEIKWLNKISLRRLTKH